MNENTATGVVEERVVAESRCDVSFEQAKSRPDILSDQQSTQSVEIETTRDSRRRSLPTRQTAQPNGRRTSLPADRHCEAKGKQPNAPKHTR